VRVYGTPFLTGEETGPKGDGVMGPSGAVKLKNGGHEKKEKEKENNKKK
jgi:hypothetical protein